MSTTDARPGAPYTIDDIAIEHAGDATAADGRAVHRLRAVEKAPRRPGLGPLAGTITLGREHVESTSPVVRLREESRAAVEGLIVRGFNEVAAAVPRTSPA